MKLVKDIPYGERKRCLLDLYLPDGAQEFPVFLYFHGGGLVGGDKADAPFAEALVKKGVGVVSASYSLYPHAVFPEFIRDAAVAAAWSKNHLSSHGAGNKLFICGSSAGGYLAQMLCFDKKYLGIHGIDADAISGYFFDAGQPTVHFNVLKERGTDPKRVVVDEAAPLFFVDSTRDYAPMEFVVSDHDMKNRPEQMQLMLSTIACCGHDMSRVFFRCVENSGHCSYVGEFDRNGDSIFADMVSTFIERCCEQKNR